MKKHNEGYSLVLVLVVLTVLSLVASFILSFSLRNLQSQTASVTRMQDEYKAAGEIEKIVAQLEALTEGHTKKLSDMITGDSITWEASDTSATEIELKLTIQSEQVKINCTLCLTAESEISKDNIAGPIKVKYTHYEVTSVEPTATEEGGGGQ